MKPRVPARWLAAAASILTVLSFNPAQAQSVANAQISGVVTDPSGAAIPDAKIIATQTDTNAVRTTQSGSDGAFTLPGLAIGPYKVQAEAKGFTTYEQTGIILQVGESPKINIALKLGETTERVVVSSNGAMIQTDTTSVSQVIDHARMVDLPLNGRNATQLIMLSGAANNIGPANGMSDLTGSKDYFSADAISVRRRAGERNALPARRRRKYGLVAKREPPLPFPDALQEFSVETSASFGPLRNASGAVVNAVTRSGTNEFHGNLFEFVRKRRCQRD